MNTIGFAWFFPLLFFVGRLVWFAWCGCVVRTRHMHSAHCIVDYNLFAQCIMTIGAAALTNSNKCLHRRQTTFKSIQIVCHRMNASPEHRLENIINVLTFYRVEIGAPPSSSAKRRMECVRAFVPCATHNCFFFLFVSLLNGCKHFHARFREFQWSTEPFSSLLLVAGRCDFCFFFVFAIVVVLLRVHFGRDSILIQFQRVHRQSVMCYL